MFIVCFVNPNPILHGFFEIVLSRGWGGGGGGGRKWSLHITPKYLSYPKEIGQSEKQSYGDLIDLL